MRGPSILRIRGPANVLETQLAGGSIGSPTVGVAAVFQWPRDLVVESLYFTCRSGVEADDAGLELAITDDALEAMVSDSLGPEAASARALFGKSRRWFPLMRPVRARAKWTFQFQNSGASAVIPFLFVRVR